MKQHKNNTIKKTQRAIACLLLTCQLLSSCGLQEELIIPKLSTNEQQERYTEQEGDITSRSSIEKVESSYASEPYHNYSVHQDSASSQSVQYDTQTTAPNTRQHSIHRHKGSIFSLQKATLLGILMFNTFAHAHRPSTLKKEYKQHLVNSESDSISIASQGYEQPITLAADDLQIPTHSKERPRFARAKNIRKYAFVNETSTGKNMSSEDRYKERSSIKDTVKRNQRIGSILKLQNRMPKKLIEAILIPSISSIWCEFNEQEAQKQVNEDESMHYPFYIDCYGENSGPQDIQTSVALAQILGDQSNIALRQCVLNQPGSCTELKFSWLSDVVNTTSDLNNSTDSRVFYGYSLSNLAINSQCNSYTFICEFTIPANSNDLLLFSMQDTVSVSQLSPIFSGYTIPFIPTDLFNKIEGVYSQLVSTQTKVVHIRPTQSVTEGCSTTAETFICLNLDFKTLIYISTFGKWEPARTIASWKVDDCLELNVNHQNNLIIYNNAQKSQIWQNSMNGVTVSAANLGLQFPALISSRDATRRLLNNTIKIFNHQQQEALLSVWVTLITSLIHTKLNEEIQKCSIQQAVITPQGQIYNTP